MNRDKEKQFDPGELPPPKNVLVDNFMNRLIWYIDQRLANEIYGGDSYNQKLNKCKMELRKALEELL